MRIQHQAPALDVSLPPLRSGWRWPPRDMLDAAIGEAVFDSDYSTIERDRILDRREWPEGRHVIDGHEAARLAASKPRRAEPARTLDMSTITVGSQLHDELTDVTPITPEAEAALELRLGSMSPRDLDGVRHQAGLEAAFARMAKLSDKTMREIRDHADRVMREREAEAERAARRVERVAEVVFVTLLAIGFLIWAL